MMFQLLGPGYRVFPLWFPHLNLLAVPGLLSQQGDGLLPDDTVLLQALLLWKLFFCITNIYDI